jgi:hypothetical protein
MCVRQVPNPEFEGQTKTRLGNPEVRKIVEGVVAQVRAPLSPCGPAVDSVANTCFLTWEPARLLARPQLSRDAEHQLALPCLPVAPAVARSCRC